MKKKFVFVEDKHLDHLEDKINEKVEGGYRVNGNFITDYRGYYVQAMVLKEKNSNAIQCPFCSSSDVEETINSVIHCLNCGVDFSKPECHV